jgi:hypothetical protein
MYRREFFTLRDLTREECEWLPFDIPKGTHLREYVGHTYGVITRDGVAVEIDGRFYEVPRDALEVSAA